VAFVLYLHHVLMTFFQSFIKGRKVAVNLLWALPQNVVRLFAISFACKQKDVASILNAFINLKNNQIIPIKIK